MKSKRIATLVIVLLAISPATAARAAKFWKNAVITGNWSTGNNWSAVNQASTDNGGVPVASENVHIVHGDGVARTVTYDVAAPTLNFLIIDLAGAGATTDTLSMPSSINLTSAAISIGGYNGSAFTNGRGAITQSGGTLSTVSGSDFIMAWGAGSTGTYTLSGGALVAQQSEWIGYSGSATVNHSAGTNTINVNGIGDFFVGTNAGASGTYNLSGTGVLACNESEYIGYSGTGTFVQTGGTNTVAGAGNVLYLGFNAGSNGTYTINAGTLTAGNNLVVGDTGTGTLNMSGSASVHVGTSLSINSTSNVNLNGGTLRFNSIGGTGGLSRINYAAGTIRLAGNRDLLIDTTVTGLFGGATPTIPAGKALTVEGIATIASSTGGTVRVNGGTFTSLSTLDVGHTFGTGQEYDGILEVTNGGVVNSSQGTVGFDNFTAGIATVSGLGSAWNVDSVLWIGGQGDSGTLNIRDGGLVHVANTLNLAFEGVINLDGGTLRFNEYLRFDTGQPFDGKFNFFAGTLQLAGNRSIGSDAAIADILGAAPTLTSGKGLTVEGTATLLTTVTLDGGTLTTNALAGGNYLQLYRGTLNVMNQAVTIGSGGPLGSALDVNEDMTVNVTLGITNQGLVTGDGQIGGTFANAAAGELRAEPGRSLKLTGANNTNAGQISLYGGMLDFTQNLTNSAGAFISGNGTLKATTGITNHGTMNFSGLANVVGDVTNSATGRVISSGGGPTTFHDDVTNQAGSEIRTSAGSFTVFFGAVTGTSNYTGTGTVNFEGDLKPGSSPAQLNFAGNVGFGPAATLEIELSGTTPGTQHDKLNITGNLALDGALEVSLINGFNPSAGQSFNILDWGSLAGTFSSLTLPTLAGLSWNTSQLYTNGVLSVAAPGVPGDYNNNGTVDAGDYVLWRKGGPLANEVDNPGTVNVQDYTEWRSRFGNSSSGAGSGAAGTASAAVPEPNAMILFVICAPLLLRLRRD